MRHIAVPARWLIPAAWKKLRPWSCSPAQSGGVELHLLCTVCVAPGTTAWWKTATGMSGRLAKWRDRAAQSEAEKGEPRCAAFKQHKHYHHFNPVQSASVLDMSGFLLLYVNYVSIFKYNKYKYKYTTINMYTIYIIQNFTISCSWGFLIVTYYFCDPAPMMWCDTIHEVQ